MTETLSGSGTLARRVMSALEAVVAALLRLHGKKIRARVLTISDDATAIIDRGSRIADRGSRIADRGSPNLRLHGAA